METKICKKCGRELLEENFMFNPRWEHRASVCKECAAEAKRTNKAKRYAAELAQQKEQLHAARQLRINDFTPKELMENLASRGYKGTLTYTHTEEIDITTFYPLN